MKFKIIGILVSSLLLILVAGIQNKPSIVPAPNFSARADADALRKAMKGIGTDETAIINIITQRSYSQRQEILESYRQKYDRDLIKDLKSDLSGNLEDLIVSLMRTPPMDGSGILPPDYQKVPIHNPAAYFAKELRDAMKGFGTNDKDLIRIVVSRCEVDMETIKDEYQKLYNRNLEKDIKDDTSGHYEAALIALVKGNK